MTSTELEQTREDTADGSERVESIERESSQGLPAGSVAAAIDKTAMASRLEEARRLYDLAVIVHERALFGSIDSAPLASKAVTMLLGVFLELQGTAAPSDFESLVLKVTEIAEAEGFATRELGEDLSFVRLMGERFQQPHAEVARAEGRRYDRALLRLRELFDTVQAEFDALFPPSESAFGRYWKRAALVSAGLIVGLVIGARSHGSSPAPVAGAAPAPVAAPAAAAPSGPAFTATYYRDTEFRQQAFVRADQSIAFDWGPEPPPGLTVADHFSVRWTGQLAVPQTADYDFYLTSDDGSRLFIDDKLVVDNWGNHSTLMREGRVALKQGVHPIRVEFFDEIGDAVIRLEWQSEKFPRRIVGGVDLR